MDKWTHDLISNAFEKIEEQEQRIQSLETIVYQLIQKAEERQEKDTETQNPALLTKKRRKQENTTEKQETEEQENRNEEIEEENEKQEETIKEDKKRLNTFPDPRKQKIKSRRETE